MEIKQLFKHKPNQNDLKIIDRAEKKKVKQKCHDFLNDANQIGPNKEMCVLGNGSESLRLGRHSQFLMFFFSGKIYNFMHFERHFAFQNA